MFARDDSSALSGISSKEETNACIRLLFRGAGSRKAD